MTKAFTVIALTLAVVGVVALVLALIGGTGVDTFTANGQTTTTTTHFMGSFVPAVVAFALALIAGVAAFFSRIIPG